MPSDFGEVVGLLLDGIGILLSGRLEKLVSGTCGACCSYRRFWCLNKQGQSRLPCSNPL